MLGTGLLWFAVTTLSVLHGFTDAQRAQIRATPIGKTVSFSAPAGDGCNTCTVVYLRINETQVRGGGVMGCTAMACGAAAPVVDFDKPMPGVPHQEGQR